MPPARFPPLRQAYPRLQPRDDAWFLDLEGREYRVAGLEKTIGTDALKITLRLRDGERFHLDQVDLCRDSERRRFVERAAEETGLTADLLKRDLGRLLARGGAGANRACQARRKHRARRHRSPRRNARRRCNGCASRTLSDGCARRSTRRASSARKPTRWLRIWRACRASWKGRWPSSSRARAPPGKTTLMDAVLELLPGGGARQVLAP